MRVLVAGGSGLIGGALVRSLLGDSHQVVVLTRDARRRPAVSQGVRAVAWDGRTLAGWVEEVAAADAVVQLAGESIFGRWSAAKKRRLVASRVESSRVLAEACAAVRRRPAVFVQGSGIGYYGDQGDREVDEESPPGEDFFAELAVQWEAASAAVEALGIRRPVVRTSVVLAREGGALPLLRLAHLAFVGGRLGNGRQWMPWIHLADQVGAVRFLLEHPQATGPFDLVAPQAVRNAELAAAVGAALHRPSWLPAPRLALRLVLGELADALLAGQRARPARLLAFGYRFRYPELSPALADLLGSE